MHTLIFVYGCHINSIRRYCGCIKLLVEGALEDKGFKVVGQFGILGDFEKTEKAIGERYGQGAVEYFRAIRQYMPDIFSSSYFSIPFPEISKEMLFILNK